MSDLVEPTTNDRVKAAKEWAEGDGFNIIYGLFEEQNDGTFIYSGADPRNILCDAHLALAAPASKPVVSREALAKALAEDDAPWMAPATSRERTAFYLDRADALLATSGLFESRESVQAEVPKRSLMTEPHDGHPDTEMCPGCPHDEPKLDPRPYLCSGCGSRYDYPSDDYPGNRHVTGFSPRPEFSQNPTDYGLDPLMTDATTEDYTPTTERVRVSYVNHADDGTRRVRDRLVGEEFDRWLATERAAARRAGMEEAEAIAEKDACRLDSCGNQKCVQSRKIAATIRAAIDPKEKN